MTCSSPDLLDRRAAPQRNRVYAITETRDRRYAKFADYSIQGTVDAVGKSRSRR